MSEGDGGRFFSTEEATELGLNWRAAIKSGPTGMPPQQVVAFQDSFANCIMHDIVSHSCSSPEADAHPVWAVASKKWGSPPIEGPVLRSLKELSVGGNI